MAVDVGGRFLQRIRYYSLGWLQICSCWQLLEKQQQLIILELY